MAAAETRAAERWVGWAGERQEARRGISDSSAVIAFLGSHDDSRFGGVSLPSLLNVWWEPQLTPRFGRWRQASWQWHTSAGDRFIFRTICLEPLVID